MQNKNIFLEIYLKMAAAYPPAANPPCAVCFGPVGDIHDERRCKGMPILTAECCQAMVCHSCYHLKGRSCLFCKKTIPRFIWRRRCKFESDFGIIFQCYKKLEEFKNKPLFLEFLKASGPFEYTNTDNLHENYLEYMKFKAHAQVVGVLSLLAGVNIKRIQTRRWFLDDPNYHITGHRMSRIACVTRMSFLWDYIKLKYPMKDVLRRDILRKGLRKYLHFGSVFFITLKLSTLLLNSILSSVPNAVRLIVCRFSKEILLQAE